MDLADLAPKDPLSLKNAIEMFTKRHQISCRLQVTGGSLILCLPKTPDGQSFVFFQFPGDGKKEFLFNPEGMTVHQAELLGRKLTNRGFYQGQLIRARVTGQAIELAATLWRPWDVPNWRANIRPWKFTYLEASESSPSEPHLTTIPLRPAGVHPLT